MQASSIGGGRIMVNKLDGIEVNFNGTYNTLVIRNLDYYSSEAAVTTILSQFRINIANMRWTSISSRSRCPSSGSCRALCP